MQPPVRIHAGVGPECLHHSLAVRLCVVGVLQHNVAVLHDRVHISLAVLCGGAQVPLVVRSHRAESPPVFLRMNKDLVVLGRVDIQHRLQHFVLDLDELQCLVHGLLIFPSHDSHSVPHKAESLVQDQPVVGAGLGVGLASHGKALVRHIPVGVNGLNAGHLHGNVRVDLLHEGVGVRAVEHLHHKTV